MATTRAPRHYLRVEALDKPHEHTPPTNWTVPQVWSQYGLPTNLPGGGIIGIYAYAGAWSSSDMTTYFGSISQPVPSITDVSVDGTSNNGTSSGGAEITADIQVAAAAYYAATGSAATIRVYWDNNSSLPAAAIAAAAADGCDVFTISWGWPEYFAITIPADATKLSNCEAAALAAVNAGMVVFAAAGDDDANDGLGFTSLDNPANCPHIIGVGGTVLGLSSEVVWNNNPGNPSGVGTGGGFSGFFSAQPWQVGIPTAPSGLGRMVPDVASIAKAVLFYKGGVLSGQGTSLGGPFWAGLTAACGAKLGFIAPKLYGSPSAFNDITSGDNGTYYAATGPDAVSGMGSPTAALTSILTTMGPFLLEGGGSLLLEGGGNLQLEGI